MTRCLPEYTLLLLYTGEGTEPQRTHLRTCPPCIARYQRLSRDMEQIERMLKDTPPPRSRTLQPVPLFPRWLPAVAVLAATLLLLIWGSIYGRHLVHTVLVAQTQPQPEAPSWGLGRDTAPAVLSGDEDEGDDDDDDDEDDEDDGFENPKPESDAAEILVLVSSSAYVQAALEGGWPCEWQAPFHTAGCELPHFPLVLGEQ